MSGNDYFPKVSKFMQTWTTYTNIKNKSKQYKDQYLVSVSENEIEMNWPFLNRVLGIYVSAYGPARKITTQIKSDILPKPQDVVTHITVKCLETTPTCLYSHESKSWSVILEKFQVVLSKNEPTKRDAYISALTSDEFFNLIYTTKGITRQLFDETLQEYAELIDRYIDNSQKIQTYETEYYGNSNT